MLHRIFGRKKYGKTEYVFGVLEKNIKQGKKTFLIVPEQYSLSMERRIVRDFGNTSNLYIEVLGFTRLCNRVFREAGGISQTYFDEAGKLLCMSKALMQLSDILSEYKNSASTPEFAASALSAVEELSMYNVSHEQLDKILPDIEKSNTILSHKLKDISLIGAAYRSVLKSTYGTDGEELDRLAFSLDGYDFFGGSDVVLDAFYGFTPQELNVLKRIIRQSDNTFITFASAKYSQDPIFARATNAAFEIKRIADVLNVEIIDTELKSPLSENEISIIEKGFSTESCLFSQKDENKKESSDVSIISCKNQTFEAKAASAIITKLISEKKARFRDIAICARDIGSFSGIIDLYLDKANIPYNFSHREDLLTKPVISYITTAFDFISSWNMKYFLRFIKTGITGITTDECNLVENYIRTWNITGKSEFCSEWYMNPQGYSEEYTKEDELRLEVINDIKARSLDCLIKFSEDIKAAETEKDMALAVYALMCDSNACTQQDDEDMVSTWNLTVKALEELTRVFCDCKLSANKFAELFKMTISQYSIAKLPDTVDCVHLGSADLMRGFDVKYMIVLGCNNEYFPAKSTGDSIFSQSERALLQKAGVQLAPHGEEEIYDEFFLAYNIFCEPSCGLYLTYSQKDISGTNLRISPLCLTVSGILGGLCEKSYPFAELCDNVTTKKALIDDMYDYDDPEFVAASLECLCEDSETKKAIESANSALYAQGKLSQDVTRKLFGGVINSSPSRFDTYSRCRFNYFNRYLLGVYPEVRAQLNSAQTGLVSHKVLELFVKELAKSKVEGKLLSKEKAGERILELLDIHLESITHSKGKQNGITKRFQYLYKRLGVILVAMAENLVDEMLVCDFLPVDYEVTIGFTEDTVKTHPIDICDPDGNVTGILNIVGQVDRADIFKKDGKTYLRIVDYKTGYKKFNANDVAYGFNLQMLLYLFCMQYSETKRYGDNIVPAGVLYIPVKRPSISAKLGDSTEKVGNKGLLDSFKGNGILVDDMDILNAMERGIEGRFIPAKIIKSGALSKYSNVVALEELGKLLKKAALVSSKLAYSMQQGNVQTNPYSCEISSCSSCDYMPICRLDRKNPNIRYTLQEVEE